MHDLSPRPEQRTRRYVAAFFALLTVLGLLTLGDYGVYCDEASEQVILQENLKEYAARLGADEAVRYYDSIGVRRISESKERDHGQAAYYLAAPILQVEDGWLRSMLWHLWAWLWFMGGVYALYSLCRFLGVQPVLACAASLLLYLSPRFFAEGHYNNKDTVLLSLALMTLALGARFLADPTWRRALGFSLAGALAANARVVGAWAWGLVCLFTLIRVLALRKRDARTWLAGAVALLSFVGFYALLTPALWANAGDYLAYLMGNATGFSRWTGAVLFDGVLRSETLGWPVPRLYLPLMILYTTPIAYLLVMLVGQFRALVAWKRAKGRRLTDGRVAMLVLLTVFWSVPLLFAVICRPLVYNGWRHFYFVYAGLCALGGYGLQSLTDAMRKAAAGRAICAFALCGCFLFYGYGILVNHPYQYAYYNSLLTRADAESNYELDYWNVSVSGALRRLCTDDRNAELALTVGATDEMSEFGVRLTYDSLPKGYRALLTYVEDPAEANYLYVNATYSRIYGTEPPAGYNLLFRLQSYGCEIGAIYERVEK